MARIAKTKTPLEQEIEDLRGKSAPSGQIDSIADIVAPGDEDDEDLEDQDDDDP